MVRCMNGMRPHEWNPDANDPNWYRSRGIILVRNGQVHEHVIELRSRRTDEYVGVDVVHSTETWPMEPKTWTSESQVRFVQYWERRNAGRLWRRV
jgi:hypothetical protein